MHGDREALRQAPRHHRGARAAAHRGRSPRRSARRRRTRDRARPLPRATRALLAPPGPAHHPRVDGRRTRRRPRGSALGAAPGTPSFPPGASSSCIASSPTTVRCVSWESRATRSRAPWSTSGMTSTAGHASSRCSRPWCSAPARSPAAARSAPTPPPRPHHRPRCSRPRPPTTSSRASCARATWPPPTSTSGSAPTSGGDVRTLTGTGSAAVAQGYGDMTWTDASGAVTRELSNGKGLFVQTDVPDGMWTRLPDERATPTGRLADPLRGLGGLADVTRHGPEDLDGVPATRFTGSAAGCSGEPGVAGVLRRGARRHRHGLAGSRHRRDRLDRRAGPRRRRRSAPSTCRTRLRDRCRPRR